MAWTDRYRQMSDSKLVVGPGPRARRDLTVPVTVTVARVPTGQGPTIPVPVTVTAGDIIVRVKSEFRHAGVPGRSLGQSPSVPRSRRRVPTVTVPGPLSGWRHESCARLRGPGPGPAHRRAQPTRRARPPRRRGRGGCPPAGPARGRDGRDIIQSVA